MLKKSFNEPHSGVLTEELRQYREKKSREFIDHVIAERRKNQERWEVLQILNSLFFFFRLRAEARMG